MLYRFIDIIPQSNIIVISLHFLNKISKCQLDDINMS